MFDWITGWIEAIGPWGVALLMFLENVFPPIPSELVMPLAGFQAAKGEANILVMIAAGSIGSLAGATFWYYVGLWYGRDRLRRLAARYGRWITITPQELDQAEAWFSRYGGGAVFFGRLVPTVRTLISVPAGLTEMPLPRFLAYSAAGTVLWTTFLALLGYLLEAQYHRVEAWLDPVSTAVVVAIVLLYIWRVATYSRRVARGEGYDRTR